ncbi:MAG: hypothetical protein ACC742_11405 [Thermoanaerobaculales bacterium]
MRFALPAVTLILAAAWLFSQALDLPWIAASAAVVALGAVCAPAVRRRAPARRLPVFLIGILLFLAAGLVFLLQPANEPADGLLVQVAIMAVLAPIVPLVYALTFSDGRDHE